MESEYLNRFITERCLAEKSISTYKGTVRDYENFQKADLDSLIREADDEEEQGIRLKRRTLKTRLINYRSYLIENFSKNTMMSRMSQIKAIYHHFEIEVPKLPYLNKKALKISEPITYDDMLTKEIIADAVNFSTPLASAIILLGVSSGMGKREMLNLTIYDFLVACDLPLDKDIKATLLEVYRNNELFVPTFKLKRQKVNEYYYTFASHESVEAIAKMLLQSPKELHLDDALFDVSESYLTKMMQGINDLLGLGKVGNYNRFRLNMLRKFNATALKNGENALSEEDIDFLQGRSRGSVRELYMKENPLVLKEKYLKAMDNILIFHESEVIQQQNEEIAYYKEQLDKIMSLLSKFDIDVGTV